MNLTKTQIDAFGRELDALRDEVRRDLGLRDVVHVRRVIRAMRVCEASGRLLLHFGLGPVSFGLGAAALGVSKILENMEVGHNVMHGQYDWTGDPELVGRDYDWDVACDATHWREYHNFEHHTFTNVHGRDRDIGYGFLRVTSEQPWEPHHLLQPITAPLLALFFQWGVGGHGVRSEEMRAGRQSREVTWARAKDFFRKGARVLAKDYLFFPALALANAPRVVLGNLVANSIRNLWSFGIIFCGHFPEGVRTWEAHEIEGESRGEWYLRQIEGSANIEGGALFHVLSGHLSHQIEHHLFPDLPAARYPEMAPRVRAICAKYGVRYTTGSFVRQLGSVAKRLLLNTLPEGDGAARRRDGRRQGDDKRGTASVTPLRASRAPFVPEVAAE
jgi:linoleoyl-CoA desaturase